MSAVTFAAGSADDIVIPLTDGNGAAITSFSGWTGKAQVRFFPDLLAAVLYEWNTTNGTLVLGDSAATLKAPLPATSLAWTWRYAWLDLRLVDSASKPSVPYRGPILINPAYTR
jgi:hypothetical protein